MRNRNVLSGYRNIPPGIGNNKIYALLWPAGEIEARTPTMTMTTPAITTRKSDGGGCQQTCPRCLLNDIARVPHMQAHEVAHIAGTHAAQFVR